MVAIADNGMFSQNIRDLLGMAPLVSPIRTESKEPASEKEETRKDNVFQDTMLKATKEQTQVLKKLLERKNDIGPTAVAVASGLVAANIASRIPIIQKTMDALDKLNTKAKATTERVSTRLSMPSRAYPVYARSPSGVPRIPAVMSAGRPVNQSMVRNPGVGGLATGGADSMLTTLGTLGLGGLGATYLTGGASKIASVASGAAGFAGKVASKVALPLAAGYAAYEGIKGGLDAENILGRQATTMDKVRVGINEAIDGVLLGLPSLITKNVFGQKYSVAVNDLMINVGDSISSVVSNSWNSVRDNSLKAFESIYNSFPSFDQISTTFGAVRDKLYDTTSNFASSVYSNTSSFLSNASTWISGAFNKATSSVGSFLKGSDQEKLRIENNINEMFGPAPSQTIQTANKSAEIVGEKVSDYLDEKLKRRDEGFMSWLKSVVGFGSSLSPSSDPVDSKGMTIGSGTGLAGTGAGSGGVTGLGGNNSSSSSSTSSSRSSSARPSVNSSNPAASFTPEMSVVGKTANGQDAKIPLPPDASRLISSGGKFDLASPTGGLTSSVGSAIKDEKGKVLTTASTDMDNHKRALLDTIAVGSGKGNFWESPDYNTIVGGKKFDSFADHPRVFGTATSTAAGRYQFTKTTWDDVTKRFNAKNPDDPIKDFSPRNQDRAAYFLAQGDYKRRTGRDLDADLKDPNLSDADKGKLIKQGLGGAGANTTWEIFQKKSDSEVAGAFKSQMDKYNNAGAGDIKGGYKEPSFLGQGANTTQATKGLSDSVPVKGSDGKTSLTNLDEAAKAQKGQAFGGGETHSGTLTAAKAINALQGDNINRFTAFNDNYHAGSRSKHAVGLAGDYTVKDANKSGESAEQLRNMFTKAGLTEKDFRIIDEYKNPSARATAGHIHYQFNSPEAAGAFVKAMGDPKIRQSMGIKDEQMAKPLDDKIMSKADVYNNSPFLKARNNIQGFDDSKPNNLVPENIKAADKKAAEEAAFMNSREYKANADPVKKSSDIQDNTRSTYTEDRANTDITPEKMQSEIKEPETKNDVTPAEESFNTGSGGFNDNTPANFSGSSGDQAAVNSQQVFNSTPSIDNELAMLSVNSSMLS